MGRAITSTMVALVVVAAFGAGARAEQAPARAPAGPTIVLETVKGVIEIETFPKDAPKTVAAVLDLVKRGFYNGLRFHRVVPKSLIQIGDPQSRNVSLSDYWGSGGSGKQIGVLEATKRRPHLAGAVAMAHTNSAADAESQFYITLRPMPSLDGKYTVFGRVTKGLEVAAKIQKTDVLKKASIR